MAKFGQITRYKEKQGLGICFLAILAWIFLEYGRPGNPLKLPLIISSLLFFNWLVLPRKKWTPQIACFFLLLGEMLLTIPFANNSFSAFWATYELINILIFICIPLIHFVDSLRKMTILINTYLVMFLYVGVYAILNSGFGPARSGGAQDENYTAAMMCMAIPLAYFSLYSVKGSFKKLLLVGALGVYVAAVVVGSSRGGFIGMVVVFLYCLLKSPKKWIGISVAAVAVIAVLTFAANEYWQDMKTITDTKEATVDLRLEAWSIAFRMFLDNPLFGVGPANFMWNAATYQSAEQLEKFGRLLFLQTHSIFFELLADLGLVGLGLFGAVLYFNYKDINFMTQRLQKWNEDFGKEPRGTPEEYKTVSDDSDRIRCYAYGLMGSIIGGLATFAFLSAFYFSNLWVLTAMIVALKELAAARMVGYRNQGTVAAPQESYRSAVSWRREKKQHLP